jgi:uncharacterized membrane protein YdjX (TVP38/TMEM64 family)
MGINREVMVSEQRGPMRWWVWVVAGVILVASTVALIIWWRPIYGFVSDPVQVRTWIEGFGPWGPIAIVGLQILQALVAPIPGQALQAVAGYLYGPWLGTLYSVIGMVIGSFLTFALARQFGRPLIVRLVGQKSMDRLDELVRRGGAPFFFLIWLFPFAPDDLACIAAGLTPMPLGQFMILMPLGRLPGVFVSVWIGANAAEIKPIWWVVLFGIIAVAALAWWRRGEQIQEAVLGFIQRMSDRLRS